MYAPGGTDSCLVVTSGCGSLSKVTVPAPVGRGGPTAGPSAAASQCWRPRAARRGHTDDGPAREIDGGGNNGGGR
eukprot:scaffold51_cov401-Prasinococcus_capsulatus_cf.AAC.1